MTDVLRLGEDAESYAAALDAAREALLSGAAALLPAEGLYGLHADAFARGAPARLRAIKQDAGSRPFILLVGTLEHALTLVRELPGPAADLMREAWPGPLTLLLPACEMVPPELCPEGMVAVRCPGSRLLRELALALPAPILSTSANRSGEPAPRSLAAVDPAVLAACAVAVDAGALAGIGSTLVRPERDGSLTVLRAGLWKPPA
jgi:tRNA threonylcarbamoyl adenosine modification protein (Sua5/YciO/YrdC/YwlC family)